MLGRTLYWFNRMPVAFQRHGFLQVFGKFLLCYPVYLGRIRPWKAVEEGVDAAVPLHFGYVVVLGKKPVQLEYLRGSAHGNSPFPVRKCGNAEVMLLILRTSIPYKVLLRLAAMAHCNMPAVFPVNSIHYPAESLAVNG